MILDLEAKPDFDSDDEAVIKMKKSAYRRSQDHIAEMLAAEVDGDDEEGDVTLTPVDKDKVKMELKTKDGYKHKMYLQKSRKDVKDVAIRLLGMEDSTVDKVRQRLKVILILSFELSVLIMACFSVYLAVVCKSGLMRGKMSSLTKLISLLVCIYTICVQHLV